MNFIWSFVKLTVMDERGMKKTRTFFGNWKKNRGLKLHWNFITLYVNCETQILIVDYVTVTKIACQALKYYGKEGLDPQKKTSL